MPSLYLVSLLPANARRSKQCLHPWNKGCLTNDPQAKKQVQMDYFWNYKVCFRHFFQKFIHVATKSYSFVTSVQSDALKFYICGWNRCPLRHKYYISVYLETVARLLKSVGMGVSSREGFQQWGGSFDGGLYIYGFLLLRFLACFLNDNCRWKLEYFVNNCDVLWIWHLNGHKMVCEWTYLWKLSIQLFQLTHPLSQNAPSING